VQEQCNSADTVARTFEYKIGQIRSAVHSILLNNSIYPFCNKHLP
jgi:hypothetical protein